MMSTVPLRIEATARAQAVANIRSAVRAWLTSREVPGERAEEILLAVSEAVTNSVEHAYPPDAPGVVIIDAEVAGGTIRVSVADHGHWREPVPAAGGKIGLRGRGLNIVRALATRLRIHHGTDGAHGTTIEAEFHLTD